MKQTIQRISAGLLVCLLLCAAFSLTVPAQTAQLRQADDPASTSLTLIPGGVPFGVKFTTNGILIVGFSDISQNGDVQNPARAAGLKIKDVLTHVNGEAITSAEHLTRTIQQSEGHALSLTYQRGGKTENATLTPLLDTASGEYKTGLLVRDSGAGIGTVTFVVPKSNAFAGLGHGICDVDTGELMPLSRGSVVDVTISGVHRGMPGTPGEIKGYFSTTRTGTLLGNTPCGVYGIFATLPDALSKLAEEPLPVAHADEIHEGEAIVYCTLSSNERRAYSIRISSIDRDATGSKCFSVRITDPALLEESGGIVQGMSGSPIIQNGKLVGAVTHVMINDPTTGYGIFIENMLNAANIPMAKAS